MEERSPWKGPVKWVLGATGLGTLVGVGGVFGFLHWRKALVLALIFLVLFGLIWGGYWLFCERRKRKARRGETSLLGQIVYQKLQDGLKELKTKARAWEGLPPWYLVVGMPASGKTTLLLNSGLFPAVLNPIRQTKDGHEAGQESQEGGTKGMNFLFAKVSQKRYAVVLDTAGRLLTGPDKVGGEESLWTDFLKQLKSCRGRTPINGLFLFVPVDHLIGPKDRLRTPPLTKPEAILDADGGLIGRRLLELQGTSGLDLRFPVYIIVSKCDLLTGFREFTKRLEAEVMASPEDLTQQILGWSKPGDLDEPTDADQVGQWVEAVAAAVERRALSWLQNPAPLAKDEDGQAQRPLDDFDSTLALPRSLRLLVPRLKLYLKSFFEMDDQTTKPLFFRGIYFTSALQTGSVLDETLARRLNVDLSELQLNGGQVEVRDKSFFITDVFRQKAFQETELVTDATSTRRLRRNRRIWYFASLTCALALLVLVSLFFRGTLRRSIGPEKAAWAPAGDKSRWTAEGYWQPIVLKGNDGVWVYQGQVFSKGLDMTLEQYHSHLVSVANREFHPPLIFKPIELLVGGFSGDRRRAQRIIAERSLVRPLVGAARERMVSEAQDRTLAAPVDAHWMSREVEALLALLELEKQAYQPARAEEAGVTDGLTNLVNYVTGTNQSATSIAQSLRWTYGLEGRGRRNPWPPKELCRGVEHHLSDCREIQAGLELFGRNLQRTLSTHQAALAACNAARDLVRDFARAESDLLAAARAGGDVNSGLATVHTLRTRLDAALQAACLAPMTNNVLGRAYDLVLDQTRRLQDQGTRRFKEFAAIKAPLFQEVVQYLANSESNSLLPEIQAARGKFGELNRELEFDAHYLLSQGDKRLYQVRDDLYQAGGQLRMGRTFKELLGTGWKAYQEELKKASQVEEQVQQYRGTNWFGGGVEVICGRLLGTAKETAIQGMLTGYQTEASRRLLRLDGTTLKELKLAKEELLEGLDTDWAGVSSLGKNRSLVASVGSQVTDAKERLLKGYAQARVNELRYSVGFPILLQEQRTNFWGSGVRDWTKGVLAELDDPVLKFYGKVDESSVEDLRRVFANTLAVAKSLYDENCLPVGIEVSLPEQNSLHSRCSYLELRETGSRVNTTEAGAQALGKISAQSSLTIIGYVDVEARDAKKGQQLVALTEAWAPVRCITEAKYNARSEGGRKWTVGLPMAGGGVLALSFQFPAELVPLDRWRDLTK